MNRVLSCPDPVSNSQGGYLLWRHIWKLGSRLVHKCVHTTDETGQNCSVSNTLRTTVKCLRLLPTQFTPPTRQDNSLFLLVSACELGITVSSTPWNQLWLQSHTQTTAIHHATSYDANHTRRTDNMTRERAAAERHRPCMNSNSLLTTVFKKRQWARRKRGYWPTTYMMLDAMIALLSLPRFCSHSPSSSCTAQQLTH